LDRHRVNDTRRAELAIQRASGFKVTIFTNHRYVTQNAASLVEARLRGTNLEIWASNSRRALVYAMQPDGSAELIPNWYGEKR